MTLLHTLKSKFLPYVFTCLVILALVAFFVFVAERYDYSTSISWLALLIASCTLVLFIFQLRNSLRPFVSIGEIEGEVRYLPQNSPPYVLVSLSLPFHNTGTIPAVKLNISTSIASCDNNEELSYPRKEYIPALPPNVTSNVLHLSVPTDSNTQHLLNSSKLRLEISVTYQGLKVFGTIHKTLQAYRIEMSTVRLSDPKLSPFVIRPIDPTYFT